MNGVKQTEEIQSGIKKICCKCPKPAVIVDDKKYYCVLHYCYKHKIVLKK